MWTEADDQALAQESLAAKNQVYEHPDVSNGCLGIAFGIFLGAVLVGRRYLGDRRRRSRPVMRRLFPPRAPEPGAPLWAWTIHDAEMHLWLQRTFIVASVVIVAVCLVGMVG